MNTVYSLRMSLWQTTGPWVCRQPGNRSYSNTILSSLHIQEGTQTKITACQTHESFFQLSANRNRCLNFSLKSNTRGIVRMWQHSRCCLLSLPEAAFQKHYQAGTVFKPSDGGHPDREEWQVCKKGALSILVSLYHDFPSQPRGRETFYNPLTLPCLPVDDVWACLWFIPIQKRYITGAGLNVRRQLHYYKTQIWHPLSHVQHCPHNTSLAINYLSCVKIRGTKKLCTL